MYLIFSANAAGYVSVSYNWSSQSRAKAVYFLRKTNEVLPRGTALKQCLIYGDLSYSPIDQLAAYVEQVLNHVFPSCIVLCFVCVLSGENPGIFLDGGG